MQISPISYKFNLPNINNQNHSNKQETQKRPTVPFYPKNYQPYFGARLNRTPINFYSQDFNTSNMPLTVLNYLNSNIENNSSKHPMQLQKEAFAWLPECTTIKDVQDMYPEEPLFADLKTFTDIHPRQGYLNELKYKKKVKSTEVLRSGEELTLYLLRKIYFEGKDLKEINEDFAGDAREVVLDEEKYGKEGYFLYSTLDALGISFPSHSYWSSLKATRPDKEYIFIHRTFDPTKERKPRVYTPRSPRVYTPEEIEKRRQRMIGRWLSMSPTQQANQLEKMRAGLEEKGNILFDYLSPIMLIATEQIHLSDKLVEFFKNDAADCPTDLSKLSKEQGKKLQKFWDENPKLKDEFSQAISETIKVFEKAQTLGSEDTQNLIMLAECIKEQNELKKEQRKLTSEEAIKAYMRKSIMETIGMYYKPYAEKYLNFVLNHRLYKHDFSEIYKRNILTNNEHEEENTDKMSKIMNNIHKEFVTKNRRETIAVNTAVAEIIYRITKDSLLFSANNTQLLLSTIAKNNLENYVSSCGDIIEQKIKNYTSGFSEEELRTTYKLITGIMGSVCRNGYLTLADESVRKRAQHLPKILKQIEKDKKARNHFKNFLREYEAQAKFAQGITPPNELQFYMIESIIDDYLITLGL